MTTSAPSPLHPRHHDLRLLDDPGEPHPALDVRGVPDRDAGRDEPEDADRDRLLAPDLDPLHDVGPEDRAPGVPVDRVRREQRVTALLLEGAQGVEAVVELVVAERRGVVADGVHRGGHRMLRPARDGVDLGVVVGERGALDRVARIEGDAGVRPALLPDRLDEGRRLRDADLVAVAVAVGRVVEVVPVVDVAVQVGRAEHGEAHPLAGAVVAVVVAMARVGAGGGCGEEAGTPDGGHREDLAAGGCGEVGVGHATGP